MLFEANDPNMIEKMLTFFKRAEDEVRGVIVLIDGVDVGHCLSIDTATCTAVVYMRDEQGQPVYNRSTGKFVTAVTQGNELTVVGDRGWRETFRRYVYSKRDANDDE